MAKISKASKLDTLDFIPYLIRARPPNPWCRRETCHLILSFPLRMHPLSPRTLTHTPHRRIIRGDRMLHEREIAIGTRQTNDGNAKLVCLGDCSVFVPRVDDKERRRKLRHILKTSKT